MASYTEHLELLKKDPVADGADTFNIQTMLNNNWDKIDAAVAKKADLGENGKVISSQLPAMNYDPAGSAAAVHANLAAHIGNKSNPHGVTAAQVGARPNTWVPGWNEVTGKPDTFPPSGHTHDASQIVSGILSAARGGTGVGSIAELAALLQSAGLKKVYVGSYVGTGTWGESSPTVITCPFAPSVLIMLNYRSYNNIVNHMPGSGGSNASFAVLFSQLTTSPQKGYGACVGNGITPYAYKSEDGKTLYIYVPGDSNAYISSQFNTAGYTYFFLAVE